MKCYNKYMNEIQESEGPDMELDSINARLLKKEMNFNYQQLLGELIYTYTICRLDIAPSLILLSQYGKALAKIHYEALKQILLYLYATKRHGTTYWRSKPRNELPEVKHTGPMSKPEKLLKFDDSAGPLELHGACDAT